MADICEAAKRWGSMTPDERLQFLDQVINDQLREWGYAPVNVASYVATATSGDYHTQAIWDYDTNTVYVDEVRVLLNDDFDSGLDTANHEAVHAARDKEAGYNAGADDYVATGIEFGLPIDGEEDPRAYGPGDTVVGPQHTEVYNTAHRLTKEAMDRCRKRDDYGADNNFDFSGDELDDDEEGPDAGADCGGGTGDDFDFTIGAPTISSARDGDNDDGLLIEMGEPTVTSVPSPPPSP